MHSNSKAPPVSVVMSVYNRETFLEEAIQSVLDQTFSDFEFIIINDGSTDGSAKILNQLSKRDPRILVIHQENKGLPNALNRGIQKARGKYIARMDDDDICLPQRFERQVAYLDSHPDTALVGSRIYFIDEGGKRYRQWWMPTDPLYLAWRMLFGVCFNHPSVMMRKAPVLKVGGYNDNMLKGQASDLWMKLSLEYKVKNLEEPLLEWRRWKESSTVSNRQEQISSHLETFKHTHNVYFGAEKCNEKIISYLFSLQNKEMTPASRKYDYTIVDLKLLINYVLLLYRRFIDWHEVTLAKRNKVKKDVMLKVYAIAAEIGEYNELEGYRYKTFARTLYPRELPTWLLKRIKSAFDF